MDTNNTCFFSILIPAYNTAAYIERCLDSILEQSFFNFEIIVVSDGSTDETNEIIRRYEKRDNRVTGYIKDKNESLFKARTTAISVTKGKYVLFLDSDDYMERGFLSQLNSELERKPVDILGFSYVIEPTKKIIKASAPCDDYVNSILTEKINHTIWNKCYSRKIVIEPFLQEQNIYCNMCEDTIFSVIFLSRASTYRCCDIIGVHYVLFSGMSTEKTLTCDKIDKTIRDIKTVEKTLKSFLRLNNNENISLVDIYICKEFRNLYLRIKTDDANMLDKIEKIKYLDSKSDSNFYEEYINEIEIENKFYHKIRENIIVRYFMFLVHLPKRLLKKLNSLIIYLLDV